MSPLELARLMNAEDQNAVLAVGTQSEGIALAIDAIAERLAKGGRLIYVGAGTSGRLGVLDATECPPTFNTPPEKVVGLIAGGPAALTQAVEGAEDQSDDGENDLRAIQFTANDVFVGIATSGRTPYVLGAATYAKSIGAFTIGLACNDDSELAPLVKVMICPIVGPEVLSGSTRLKAGTATKLILNALTTGAMVRMGKTFGNLMVDLRATNSKLRLRANRIVRTVTGLEDDAASELLKRADGDVKTALIMHVAQTDATSARIQLKAFDGRVLEALCAIKGLTRNPIDSTLVIGIEGGGTNTTAVVADGARILGQGAAGPSNLQAVGLARTFDALDRAIAQAFASAGRPRVTVGAICLGLAGSDRPVEKAVIRDWVAKNRVAEWCEVTNDGSLLLAAGTPNGWGVGVVAGTGSIAVARSPDGRTARVGGWGYILGDEGSAYAIATTGLNAATKSADGRGPSTKLLDRFLTGMGLPDPAELIPAVYRGARDRTQLAALAPIVLQAAQDEDATALFIVREQARELAHMIIAAATSVLLSLNDLPLAMTGGALLKSDLYRAAVLTALSDRGATPRPMTLVEEPVMGAVRIARGRQPLTV
jgi:N-acetylmuramic acid 6-phosphate etherase